MRGAVSRPPSLLAAQWRFLKDDGDVLPPASPRAAFGSDGDANSFAGGDLAGMGGEAAVEGETRAAMRRNAEFEAAYPEAAAGHAERDCSMMNVAAAAASEAGREGGGAEEKDAREEEEEKEEEEEDEEGDDADGVSQADSERDERSESPVILWRPSGRVRIATDLPPGLKSVYGAAAPESAAGGEAAGEADKAPAVARSPKHASRHAPVPVTAAAAAAVAAAAAAATVPLPWSAERERAAAARRRRLQYGAWYVHPSEWQLQQQIREEAEAATLGPDGRPGDDDDNNDAVQRLLRRARARARGAGQSEASGERHAAAAAAAASPASGEAEEDGDAAALDDEEARMGHMVASLEARIPSLFIAKVYKAYLEKTVHAGRIPPYLANVSTDHAGDEFGPQ